MNDAHGGVPDALDSSLSETFRSYVETFAGTWSASTSLTVAVAMARRIERNSPDDDVAVETNLSENMDNVEDVSMEKSH